MEKRVISTQVQEEDLKIEKLSTRRWTIISTAEGKGKLKIYIEAAKARGNLDHVLF